MKNRDKYILKRNEYDMMCQIIKGVTNGVPCAIKVVSGQWSKRHCYEHDSDCYTCVREWLNEEEENMNPD